jgi:hypothetical protein
MYQVDRGEHGDGIPLPRTAVIRRERKDGFPSIRDGNNRAQSGGSSQIVGELTSWSIRII